MVAPLKLAFYLWIKNSLRPAEVQARQSFFSADKIELFGKKKVKKDVEAKVLDSQIFIAPNVQKTPFMPLHPCHVAFVVNLF